jgi:hypothetical protein
VHFGAFSGKPTLSFHAAFTAHSHLNGGSS